MSDTTTPKTLLQMAGAPLEPARLEQAVLMLIDCQGEYVTGALPLDGIETALNSAQELLVRARQAGTPVMHVAHRGKPGGAFDRDGAGGRIVDEVTPELSEIVIEKNLPNAFAGTDLADALERTGRKELIVAGFMTHMCVSSTVRAALDLGYRTTLVASATATRDLPGAAGTIVRSQDLQAASLAALADRFAIIARDSSEIV